MDYSAWTTEALRAEFLRLGHEFAAIGTARSEMEKELRFRENQAAAHARLASLRNPGEVEALKQLLQVK